MITEWTLRETVHSHDLGLDTNEFKIASRCRVELPSSNYMNIFVVGNLGSAGSIARDVGWSGQHSVGPITSADASGPSVATAACIRPMITTATLVV